MEKLTDAEKQQVADAKQHNLETSAVLPKISATDADRVKDAQESKREEARGRGIKMQRRR